MFPFLGEARLHWYFYNIVCSRYLISYLLCRGSSMIPPFPEGDEEEYDDEEKAVSGITSLGAATGDEMR